MFKLEMMLQFVDERQSFDTDEQDLVTTWTMAFPQR